MSNVVIIKVSVSTSKVGSECTDEFEISREEWDAMSDKEKRAYLEEHYTDHRTSYVEGFCHAYDPAGNCLSEDI